MLFAHGYALSIGVGIFQNLPGLTMPITSADAQAVAAALADPRFCGYPPDQITTLTGQAATREGVLAALAALAERLTAEDALVVFFSGPAKRDERGGFWLLTHETRLIRNKSRSHPAAGTAVSLADIAGIVQKARAEQIVIVLNSHPAPSDSAAILVTSGEGRVVIAGSREGQASFIGNGECSIVTQALLEGLRGEGVPDRGGYIAVCDLFEHMHTAVPRMVGEQIEPGALEHYGGTPEPEMFIAAGARWFPIGLYRGAAHLGAFPLDQLPASVAGVHALDVAPREAAPAEHSDRPTPTEGRPTAPSSTPRTAPAPERPTVGEQRGIFGGDLRGPAFGSVERSTVMIVDNLYQEARAALTVPHQVPPVPKHYIAREQAQDALYNAILSASDEAPLTLMYGFAGTGKTSLTAWVCEHRLVDQFPGGILWGDLASALPSELLYAFLSRLDPQWRQDSQGQLPSLREALWGMLDKRRTLIVLDNVKDAQQVQEGFLPRGRCSSRLLIVSNEQMTTLEQLSISKSIHLGAFSSEETMTLFEKLLDRTMVDASRASLEEIGKQIEYMPQLVALVALQLKADQITPDIYLGQLQESKGQRDLFQAAIWSNVELAIKNLKPNELDLFELTGVLGEGDWSAEMLAAVALRPLPDVMLDLQMLASRDLIALKQANRYRSKLMLREFVQGRLQKRAAYVYQAACHLLARYCLDAAQNTVSALRESYGLRAGDFANMIDEDFVALFGQGLLPEISHLREVFAWAKNNQAWLVLRRFALLPYMGLIRRLAVSADRVTINLNMATLIDPTIGLYSQDTRFSVASLVIGDGSITVSDKVALKERPKLGETLMIWDELVPQRSEVYLTLTASQIHDGVFEQCELIDARWLGVWAKEVMFNAVDMVGSEFVGCEFSRSVWINCDARHITTTASNMRGSLFKNVRLRGATMRDTDLCKATLEDCDLRGADLHGANFSGARLHRVNLTGCQIDGSIWAGAQISEPIYEPAVREYLDRASRLPAEAFDSAYDWVPKQRTMTGATLRSEPMPRADLRAALLDQATLASLDLSGADLRAANLEHATLTDVVLKNANLQMANLRGATLTRVALDGANLRGANLAHATLDGVTLAGAILTHADLTGAMLPGTNLSSADLYQVVLADAMLDNCKLQGATLLQLRRARLRNADLTGANLANADMSAADLSGALLRGAKAASSHLAGANLSSTDLSRAVLVGANMDGAILEDAICSEADFSTAQSLTNQQLAQCYLLGGATLPSGERVPALNGASPESLETVASLRFAELSTSFEGVDLRDRDLFGACLAGSFTRMQFGGATLDWGKLTGRFSDTDFSGATLRSARLGGTFMAACFTNATLAQATLEGGTFDHADFANADLAGAKLDLARLAYANLRGAGGLTEAQLRQAYCLRGATLPDGSQYDGAFDLAGDRNEAEAQGVDFNDRNALAAFYNNGTTSTALSSTEHQEETR